MGEITLREAHEVWVGEERILTDGGPNGGMSGSTLSVYRKKCFTGAFVYHINYT